MKKAAVVEAPRPRPKKPEGIEPVLVSRDEAAALLGVNAMTLVEWSRLGVLKPVALPSTRKRPSDKRLRRVLYLVSDLRRFAEAAAARG
jgi:hypothetical protein